MNIQFVHFAAVEVTAHILSSPHLTPLHAKRHKGVRICAKCGTNTFKGDITQRQRWNSVKSLITNYYIPARQNICWGRGWEGQNGIILTPVQRPATSKPPGTTFPSQHRAALAITGKREAVKGKLKDCMWFTYVSSTHHHIWYKEAPRNYSMGIN